MTRSIIPTNPIETGDTLRPPLITRFAPRFGGSFVRDSHARSIVKALTWRLLGLGFTFSAMWLVTRRLDLAAGVGVADFFVRLVAYYVHERVWNRVSLGRVQRPGYEI